MSVQIRNMDIPTVLPALYVSALATSYLLSIAKLDLS